MQDNGWVFISHSHKDIETVRKLRNYIESLGFEPLLFYLKCLSDDDEIDDLIKREIAARKWFIYMNSQNARESKWVQKEREIIAGYSDKYVFRIDLEKEYEKQIEIIDRALRQMKVFVSFSPEDQPVYLALKEKLHELDMQVLSKEDIRESDNYQLEGNSRIEEASHNGFVIIILSENSIRSQWVQEEIKTALRQHGRIIPLFVDGVIWPEAHSLGIDRYQGIFVSQSPSAEELQKAADRILHEAWRSVD